MALNDRYHLITVEGNTGAGKTTFARMLAEQHNAKLVLEEFVDNPFLPLFYADRIRYAFSTEVFFLMDRQKQLRDIIDAGQFKSGLNIMDYLPNKSLLYAEVNLSKEEFELFDRVFKAIYPNLPQPELVIYIHSTVPRLLKNIAKRGRDFEQVVDPNYLQMVEDLYLSYFEKNPELRVLILHTDEVDFVANPADYERMISAVDQEYAAGVHHIKL